MNDEEIATKLAEAMGWELRESDYGDYWLTSDGAKIHLDDIAPLSWSFAGIVIDWMESQEKEMTIRATHALREGDLEGIHDVIVHFRIVRFGGGIENNGSSFKNLTPRHICLAALEAL